MTSWSDCWYVVDTDVTIDSRITVSGTVHLILVDGYTLTAPKGINVGKGNSLTIYGQTAGTGTLTINDVGYNCAGIGGNNEQEGGTIKIFGGTVTANGGGSENGVHGGAGIGGGRNKSVGTIALGYATVYDSITANSYGGTVTIDGDKKFTDNTTLYSGSIQDNSAINGKILKPYGYTLTLDNHVSADYPKPAYGTTVTLSFDIGYQLNRLETEGVEIAEDNNSFVMPDKDVRIKSTPIVYAISYEVNGGTLPEGYHANYTI